MNRINYTFTSIIFMLAFTQLFSQPKITLQSFASGFSNPVDIASAGDDRLFIVEQAGKIYIVNPDGSTNSVPFLDIDPIISSGGEKGLLGLAFHPDFANNGYFFVNFTDNSSDSKVVRYTVDSQNPNVADINSEETILSLSQPFGNHNGGDLNFGPDGYLYIGFGDGGSGNDPLDNGQKTTTFHGKILRIDIDNGLPYSIPSDNPFVNESNILDEIWSLGWRNPWRFSFDRQTGDMWIADVGQGLYEEVSFETAGSAGLNYGWRCREGDHDFNTTDCGPVSDYVAPVFEYLHSFQSGSSITGGFVYRGQDHPGLVGHYIGGDYNSGQFFTIFSDGSGGWDTTRQGQLFSRDRLSTFGEGSDGEVYVADHTSGIIYKIADANTSIIPGVDALPVKLYPHPFKDVLRVEFDNVDAKPYTLKLINSQGQVVRELREVRSGDLTLERRNLAPGMYLLEIRGEKLFSG
ncbi:MAG: PQQ-dependent sugar dehydrogenase, partial [Bacteroidota bacterium]